MGSNHLPESYFNFLDEESRGGDCGRNEADDEENAPESFDARYHWFHCPSIGHIWNQGNCAADWVKYLLFVEENKICTNI